jgi:hypothetical protein
VLCNKGTALQAAEKLNTSGFVTGHDFSRADKASKNGSGFSPCQFILCRIRLSFRTFSAACRISAGRCPFTIRLLISRQSF